jgi:hypothetical protein
MNPSFCHHQGPSSYIKVKKYFKNPVLLRTSDVLETSIETIYATWQGISIESTVPTYKALTEYLTHSFLQFAADNLTNQQSLLIDSAAVEKPVLVRSSVQTMIARNNKGEVDQGVWFYAIRSPFTNIHQHCYCG